MRAFLTGGGGSTARLAMVVVPAEDWPPGVHATNSPSRCLFKPITQTFGNKSVLVPNVSQADGGGFFEEQGSKLASANWVSVTFQSAVKFRDY
jgi:hypothetical protein